MSGSPEATALVEGWLERLRLAGNLLRQAEAWEPPRLEDDAALRREARRLRPYLETLVGRPYGRLPALAYRSGLEARLAGPWSQYLTLGIGWTRLVRISPLASSRLGVPTVLAHELAHRYAFDESVTTLRGLEVSARLAAEGDPMHAVSARLELARLLLGAAMAEALARHAPGPVDAFFASRPEARGLGRARSQWARLRARGGAAPDWATTVYAVLPAMALEGALRSARPVCGPLLTPRFPLDSAQAAAAWAYTRVDGFTGRRRAEVPVDGTLALWRRAAADA